MSVPTYDRFMEPILRFLKANPNGANARDAHEAAAVSLSVTEEDKQELLPSGTQLTYKNRAGWAHDRLKRAGLSSSPRRGFWKLTDKGRDYIKAHPEQLLPHEIEQLAREFTDVQLKFSSGGELPIASSLIPAVPVPVAVASPDDRLGQAVAELRNAVAIELLDTLASVSPSFFESIVLDLLLRASCSICCIEWATGPAVPICCESEDLATVELMASFRSTSWGLRRSVFRPSVGRARLVAPRFKASTEPWPDSGQTKVSSSPRLPTQCRPSNLRDRSRRSCWSMGLAWSHS